MVALGLVTAALALSGLWLLAGFLGFASTMDASGPGAWAFRVAAVIVGSGVFGLPAVLLWARIARLH